jgi:hypothetical protein
LPSWNRSEISLGSTIRAFWATSVNGTRKSIGTLVILIAPQMDLDPLSGHLFAFCNRQRDTLKILYWGLHLFIANFKVRTWVVELAHSYFNRFRKLPPR